MNKNPLKKIRIILFFLLLTLSNYAQQNLNICALRVSFQTDQNSLTTGDGSFILDATGIEPYTIDPPPHNKSYFQDQIIAVKNYYFQASRGQVNISGKVFPQTLEGSYQLANEMSYYNPNTTEEINNQRLAQLLVDAVKLADNDPAIDFSQYNLITIFHAGVGKDIDVGFDETPQDIPSLYLSMKFLKEALGDTFSGISVDNGSVIIQNGIVLPETESQVDLQIALTGIFASNIGSHLGLLDLFSPSEQATGIGSLGLMDVGQFNVRGLMPAIPCAYSRILAGWEEPALISAPQNNIQVNRFQGQATTGNSICKIPINSDEYYLTEYRGQRTVNIDSVFYDIYESRDEEPSYLEVLETYLPNNIIISDSTGVLLSVDNYDWGLPGSGILIWHVDEKVISDKISSNGVNDDPENRGIDLEEADGSQDIGFSYGITEAGYQSEYGTWLDFWFKNNTVSPLYKNEFSTTSSPNTRSNRNYADTHIKLNNFSNNYGDVMTFDFNRDYFEEGFPVRLNNNDYIEFTSLKGCQISASESALFTSDSHGNLYAVRSKGKGFFSDSLNLFAQIPYAGEADLAIGDANSDGFGDILIVATEFGFIVGFDFPDANNDLIADTVFTLSLGANKLGHIVVHDSYFYVASEDNRIRQFDLNGNLISEVAAAAINSNIVIANDLNDVVYNTGSVFGPIVVDLNSDGGRDNIFFPDSNRIEIEFSSDDIKSYNTSSKLIGNPAIADIDLDGYYEILFHSENQIHGINYNNAQVTNMPFEPVLSANEKLIGSPLVADVDDDGLMDIISITNQGQVFGYNSNGKLLNGFPFSAGGNIIRSPLLIDIDNDNKLELFTISKNGHVNAWQFEDGYVINNLWWTQESFSADNNFFINRKLTPVASTESELLASKEVYNFPNPNKDNYTFIRYRVSEKSDVNIKIFDLAGDIVDSFSGPGDALIDHQVQWDLSDISSGIYLCRIDANTGNKSDVRIIKIMVVH